MDWFHGLARESLEPNARGAEHLLLAGIEGVSRVRTAIRCLFHSRGNRPREAAATSRVRTLIFRYNGPFPQLD